MVDEGFSTPIGMSDDIRWRASIIDCLRIDNMTEVEDEIYTGISYSIISAVHLMLVNKMKYCTTK